MYALWFLGFLLFFIELNFKLAVILASNMILLHIYLPIYHDYNLDCLMVVVKSEDISALSQFLNL